MQKAEQAQLSVAAWILNFAPLSPLAGRGSGEEQVLTPALHRLRRSMDTKVKLAYDMENVERRSFCQAIQFESELTPRLTTRTQADCCQKSRRASEWHKSR